MPGEGVLLLSDSRQTLLRGRLYELVAPWLDGRTTEDLCQQLRGTASPAAVFYTLTQLEQKDYLCEEEQSLPAGQAAMWSSQQITPAAAASRLAKCPIVVRSLGVEAGSFLDLLQSLHVQVNVEVTDGRLPDVVLTDSYLRSELQVCNSEALQAGKPWLLVKPSGRQVWIGPLFTPGKTGCWQCLAQRLQSNSPVMGFLQTRNGHAKALLNDRTSTPATVRVAEGLAGNAVASWVVRGELPELDGKMQTLDVPSWRMQTHTLIRLPFCSACGHGTDGASQPFRQLNLESRKKTFVSDGGHRIVTPEETLARYSHHISPITGAVPMLERVVLTSTSGGASREVGDGVLHVYVAGNNTARPHRDLAQLRNDLRSLNSGKGTSDAQARASGLCEGLERYSGVFRGDEPRMSARLRQLGEAAISPADCLLFSDRQYCERDTRNATASRFSFIPVQFDPVVNVEWSPVWSLTRQETRYLLTAFCYYDYPQPDEQIYCFACSNGNAAGNTPEEAVLQGFLELVERDSVALWWYSRVRRPGVSLSSFGEPYLERLESFLREHGREFWALDLTADLGIPVFAAICRRVDGPLEQIVLGFGAHLDARVALLRAVTEMNQMLSSPLLEPQGKHHCDHTADPETEHWLRTATTGNQPYLLPAEEPMRLASSYPRMWTDDLTEDVRACQTLVERAGMEMLVLDQTRPEVGLPVIKVIVPGLRHFWARFAPGRLYDVPVQMGWLPRALAEEELNPIPMFL
jgi:ribosomal protein S12 methylthiotransferase accessory factor